MNYELASNSLLSLEGSNLSYERLLTVIYFHIKVLLQSQVIQIVQKILGLFSNAVLVSTFNPLWYIGRVQSSFRLFLITSVFLQKQSQFLYFLARRLYWQENRIDQFPAPSKRKHKFKLNLRENRLVRSRGSSRFSSYILVYLQYQIGRHQIL